MLFDAEQGVWAGSGFFSARFARDELTQARSGAIPDEEPIASWPGVRTGPAIVVGRADSEAQCEIIAGVRVCPREESFSVNELEWYRPGIGPVGYAYRFSAGFSGAGISSSNTSDEYVALVSSSLRGDVTGTPTPDPQDRVPSPELVTFVSDFLTQAVGAEIASYTTNSGGAISEYMIGEPLRIVLNNLQKFASQCVYYVPTSDFPASATVDIRLLSDAKVEADRCECWSGAYYTIEDDRLVRTERRELLAQTITMQNLPNGWFITQILFHNAPAFCPLESTPTPTPVP